MYKVKGLGWLGKGFQECNVTQYGCTGGLENRGIVILFVDLDQKENLGSLSGIELETEIRHADFEKHLLVRY